MSRLANHKPLPELNTQAGDLADVPVELLQELNAAQNTRTYKKGQMIFYEGNRPFGLFYLNSGKVKLSKFTTDGKIYITRIVTAGELMGCLAFFTHDNYEVSAEVIEDASICFLEQAGVKEIQSRVPTFQFQILSKLARELREAETRAADIAYKSVSERLADLLLNFKQSFGQALDNGQCQLNIQLSREEMASLLGTTVETTVRTLSRFRQLELIGDCKKNIILKDVPKLTELVAY